MVESGFEPVFKIFDRWGSYLRDLAGVRSAVWERRVGGSDSLTIECPEKLVKGQRVVWCDAYGTWHEHVAEEPVASRSDSEPFYEVECLTPLGDLRGYHVEEVHPSGSCAAALASVLEGTGWEVGDTSGTPTGLGAKVVYRCSALEGVEAVAERWGGEPYASVEVGPSGVTRRLVNCPARMGHDLGATLYAGRDLAGVRRTVSADPVYTALYGYGKGEEVGDGYGRRLTFGDANGGVDWVGDEDARQLWGMPGPGGARLHCFGSVVFEDEEDPAELLRLTKAALDECKQPKVSYELDWAEAAAAGLADGVGLGDTVGFVDGYFDPPMRGTARVVAIRDDLMDPSAKKVTLGNSVGTLTSSLSDLRSSLSSITSASAAWQAASSAAPSFVESLMARQNALANAGLSYMVSTPELGTVCANVPLDPLTGAPLERPASGLSCLSLRAGVLRCATEHSGGAWRWRTAASGLGLSADTVATGTLNADLIRAGTIADATGKNYWDLETGDLHMSSVPQGIEDAITEVDVEYALGTSQTAAPTTGWQASAPAWQAGRYMWQRTKTVGLDGQASYSAPTCIQGAQGPAGAPGKDGADGTSVTIKGTFDGPLQLPGGAAEGDGYIIGGDLWVWTGSSWQDVGKIQGPQGPQGVPGSPGADGLTTYVHFAYANDGTGTDGFSVTPFAGAKYVGVRTDYVHEDSTDPSDYSWSLFKGTGVSAVVEEYYLSTSQTSQSGGSWSTAQPAWAEGKYIWTRSKVTWTDGTTSYTQPVLAKAINGANEAASDAKTVADAVNDQFTQQGVFNKLTNNGAMPGIFMKDGQLYVNATYLATGTIADRTGTNHWNLETGELKMNSLPPGTYYGTCNTAAAAAEKAVVCQGFELRLGATVIVYWANDTNTSADEAGRVTVNVNGTGAYPLLLGNSYITGNNISIRASRTSLITWNGTYWRIAGDDALLRANTAQRTANTASEAANGATAELANLKTQEAIFDLLTAGGEVKGIYMSGGQLYINADYIKTGTLIAERLGRSTAGYATVGRQTVNGVDVDGVVMHDSEGNVRFVAGAGTDAAHPMVYLTTKDGSGDDSYVLMASKDSVAIQNVHPVGTGSQASLSVSRSNGLVFISDTTGGNRLQLRFNDQGLWVSNGTKSQYIFQF